MAENQTTLQRPQQTPRMQRTGFVVAETATCTLIVRIILGLRRQRVYMGLAVGWGLGILVISEHQAMIGGMSCSSYVVRGMLLWGIRFRAVVAVLYLPWQAQRGMRAETHLAQIPLMLWRLAGKTLAQGSLVGSPLRLASPLKPLLVRWFLETLLLGLASPLKPLPVR